MNEQSGGASGTTQIYTFAVLHDAAHFALHEARKSPEWLFYKCLHAIVSTAFCLEAYLNHTGPQLFDCWAALAGLRG